MGFGDAAPYLLGLAAVITAFAGFGKLFVDIARITAQMSPNSGKSMKDKIDKIAETSVATQSKLLVLENDLQHIKREFRQEAEEARTEHEQLWSAIKKKKRLF